MPFGCLALAIGLSGGVIWQAGRSTITPYVVEVDKLGEVRAIGPAIEAYEPTDAQIAHHLARFIENVRSLSIDPIIVRQNWLRAYDYATTRAANTLNGIVTLTAWLRHGRCFSVSGCARYPTVVTAFHRSSSSMPSGSIAVSR